MLADKHKITAKSTQEATEYAQSRILQRLQEAERLQNDTEKEQRLQLLLCRFCHYIRNPRVGGARMTSRPCGACDTLMHFGSTATDVMCSPCATQHSLCKQCGGELEL